MYETQEMFPISSLKDPYLRDEVKTKRMKHEIFEQIEKKATLENTLNALAGLFVLNILHKENQRYLIRYTNVISAEGPGAEEFMTKGPIEQNLRPSFIGVPKDIHYKFMARTPLFIHIFRVDENITTQEYYSIPH